MFREFRYYLEKCWNFSRIVSTRGLRWKKRTVYFDQRKGAGGLSRSPIPLVKREVRQSLVRRWGKIGPSHRRAMSRAWRRAINSVIDQDVSKAEREKKLGFRRGTGSRCVYLKRNVIAVK